MLPFADLLLCWGEDLHVLACPHARNFLTFALQFLFCLLISLTGGGARVLSCCLSVSLIPSHFSSVFEHVQLLVWHVSSDRFFKNILLLLFPNLQHCGWHFPDLLCRLMESNVSKHLFSRFVCQILAETWKKTQAFIHHVKHYSTWSKHRKMAADNGRFSGISGQKETTWNNNAIQIDLWYLQSRNLIDRLLDQH